MADRLAAAAAERGEGDPLLKQSSGQGGMADIEFDGEKKIKADFIFRVYALLSAQLVLTVAIAAGVASNDSMKSVAIFLFGNTVGSIFMMIGICALICAISVYKDKYPTNLALFTLLTVLMALMVGLSCFVVTKSMPEPGPTGLSQGTETVLLAASCTAMIFISLTLYAAFSGKDFTFLGGFLFSSLFACIWLSIFAWALGLDSMRWLICVFEIFIFSGYVLYDTDMIVNRVPLDRIDMGTAIMGALSLYLDIINLFLLLLELLSDRRR